MVLHHRSPASHNHMLGQRIAHPPSTKFDEDFELPAAKRVKRLVDNGESQSRPPSDDEVFDGSPRPTPRRKEILDSEADSEEEDEQQIPRASQTELESALPAVKTDKEAIAEYEATRAAEAAEAGLNLQGRLGQRKWVQGKSSIYVDAFNLALETVLDEESHLFDEAEMAVFQRWRSMSYEGQYLYVNKRSFVVIKLHLVLK